jgi:hypothetical protein
MIDPFSDEADPARPEQRAAAHGRRPLLLALAATPLLASLGGCAHPAPACPVQPEHPERCQHRFCRHYRG